MISRKFRLMKLVAILLVGKYSRSNRALNWVYEHLHGQAAPK